MIMNMFKVMIMIIIMIMILILIIFMYMIMIISMCMIISTIIICRMIMIMLMIMIMIVTMIMIIFISMIMVIGMIMIMIMIMIMGKVIWLEDQFRRRLYGWRIYLGGGYMDGGLILREVIWADMPSSREASASKNNKNYEKKIKFAPPPLAPWGRFLGLF